MFHCNQCGNALEPDVKHVVLPCLHLYCLNCAQNQLESDSTCAQCGAMFSHKAVKGVNVLQDAGKHALTLCGQTPEVIMQSALTAVNFYVKQTELMASLREAKLQRRMELLHQQCNEKLQQVHTAYTKAKGKSAALASQLQEANADKEELHSKYQQRSSQVKQLKEQLQMLQQRQQQVGLPGPMNPGGGMAMMTSNMQGGGGRPQGRAASPSASPIQGPHMVTTVQRTQLFSNFGPDANMLSTSPNLSLPRPQLPMPGSGGQQRKSASHMQQAGMLGGSGGDMLGHSTFDMRVQTGGRPSQQQMVAQQRVHSGGGMGNMGMHMGGGKTNSGGMVGGAGMMHGGNTLNLMGSPSLF